MKSFILKSIVIILAVSIQTSCVSEDDNQCYFEFMSFVTEVTGPETSSVNQEITFEVTYLPSFGCGSFLEFNEGVQENVRYLTIFDKTTACSCTTEPVSTTINYKFTPTTPGEYTFRFKSDEDSSIIKNVTVQ